MPIIVLFIGILIAVVGIAILFAPSALKDLLHRFLDRKWLWPASIFRIVVGVLFAMAAPQTKTPQIIWVLGLIFIVAGILIPLLRRKRIDSLANWWLDRSKGILRLWALIALIFGAFLIWTAIL